MNSSEDNKNFNSESQLKKFPQMKETNLRINKPEYAVEKATSGEPTDATHRHVIKKCFFYSRFSLQN